MIKLIVVGKLKENYLKEAVEDYSKRISKYQKLEIIEINDTNIEEEQVKILSNIKQNDYLITLEIEANMIDSLELSEKINQIFTSGKSNITFVIGSSYGLGENVKKRSNYKLSFSSLTFPHGLFRIMLLEQLYRSFKILNNEEYHK